VQHLRQLEDQSVYILREAYKHFDNLAMLWSMGKDSTVLLWLARKAFFGHVPFPLLHVDTSYKIPAMIEYRDRMAREWGIQIGRGTKQRSACSRDESYAGSCELLYGLENQWT
jgi:3''-phosphoadenosine 5''-phosphosulfate sulfotransferase (PAPS reductase)/FAD synthetase and related enzymes